jgi:FkbM family methyltransferase
MFAARGSYPHVIFDVGANVGDTAERYRELFPEAEIYCFEPYPQVFAQLSARYGQSPNLHLFKLALSEQTGTASFYTFSNPVANSLLPKAPDITEVVDAQHIQDKGVIPVETITLDEFCQRQKIDHIDILKFDIQGAELKALRGAESSLRKRKIGLIYLEVQFASLYTGQAWFFDIAHYLIERGYELFDFYNFTYREDGKLKWGDALFRPRTHHTAPSAVA